MICDNTERRLSESVNLIVLICDDTERRLSESVIWLSWYAITRKEDYQKVSWLSWLRWLEKVCDMRHGKKIIRKCHLIVLICDNTERRLSESVIWLSWYAITRKEDYQKVSWLSWYALICDNDTERRLSESVLIVLICDNTERRLSESVTWLSWLRSYQILR